MKNHKNRPAGLALIVSSLAVLVLAAGCADRFVRVEVPFPPEKPMPFEQYPRIVLGNFTESITPEKLNPGIHIQDFFTRDVATLIERKIEYMPDLNPESPGLEALGNALLITGNLKTEFNRRNMIDETHNRYGDRIRKFKDVQNWRMEIEVILTDAQTGKKVSEFTAKRELKAVENTDEVFNYRKLFNQITDRFVGRLTNRERPRDRFLLVE